MRFRYKGASNKNFISCRLFQKSLNNFLLHLLINSFAREVLNLIARLEQKKSLHNEGMRTRRLSSMQLRS